MYYIVTRDSRNVTRRVAFHESLITFKNMDIKNNFERTIQSILTQTTVESQTDLVDRILLTIKRKQKNRALIRTVFFALTTTISCFGLFFVWQTESNAIVNSGIGDLLSLLFSDSAVVLNYWREYLFSMVEAVPIVSVAVIALFFWLISVSAFATINSSKFLINHAVKHV